MIAQINSYIPGQNDRHFADDILKWIFMNEKFFYFDSNFTEICFKGPTENNQALV